MNETALFSIVTTGFVVAFAHAAIPTHWLPFVLAARGQRWSKAKTLLVVAFCGSGHVLFTTALGVLVVWLGVETSKWTGNVFPWIAGGVLILIGIYYLVRQARGSGHGHHHFGGGHSHAGHDHAGHEHGPQGHSHAAHDHAAHDRSHAGHAHGAHAHPHGGHDHASETKRIDTGHGVLLLEVFEDGVPPRFRVKTESGGQTRLPSAAALSLETVRPAGARQTFSFVARDGYLESVEEIPEPHDFTASLVLSHGDHAHRYAARFAEHGHAAVAQATTARAPTGAATRAADQRPGTPAKSDTAVILGLFALLTFSPCEGFLPVYLSGIAYGWTGFIVLSAVLAVATVGGMVTFTWLTMSGIEHLRLGFLERYESGILGALILFLGVGTIFFGF